MKLTMNKRFKLSQLDFFKITGLEIGAKAAEGRRKDMTWREQGSNREHAGYNSTPYKKEKKINKTIEQ